LKAPEAIRIGDVVRASETDFRLVECFDARTNVCTLTPSCRLKHLFDAALQAYFRALDGATLADMVASDPPRAATRRVGAAGPRPAVAIAVAAPPSRLRPAKAAAPRG
ncbi:MAG: Rrf2 family transcriptional regulator, partial [Burkholderiaceae bacterium]|nr:Rrf2 family transcriptional regulator [Burkholderiaceae bacterium]